MPTEQGNWVVGVEGWGEITVKKPELYDDETMAAAISEAVVGTLNLTVPTNQFIFHPVLGWVTRKVLHG